MGYVQFNKQRGVFYRGIKPRGEAEWFYNPIKHDKFIERPQKHSTKSMSLGSPNKGSNCEGKISAYKKNRLCLISILYIKNINEECFLGI